jgi:hypothetical protein
MPDQPKEDPMDAIRAKINARLSKEPPPLDPVNKVRAKVHDRLNSARPPEEQTLKLDTKQRQRSIHSKLVAAGGDPAPKQVGMPALENFAKMTREELLAIPKGPDPFAGVRTDPALSPEQSPIITPTPRNEALDRSLQAVSDNRLQITRGVFTPEQMDRHALDEAKVFEQETPNLHASMLNIERASGMSSIRPMADQMASINKTPPDPRELRDVAETARQIWGQFIQAGGQFTGPITGTVRAQADFTEQDAAIVTGADPELFQQVFSKMYSGNSHRTWFEAKANLDINGPLGNEVELAEALGPNFLDFVNEKQQYLVANHRIERLTGQPVALAPVRDNPFDDRPSSAFTQTALPPASKWTPSSARLSPASAASPSSASTSPNEVGSSAQ